jgi:hypothetical protein
LLDRVTITGADDSTDPLEMLDLALAYPWLEFGILVSASREGSPRYPSRGWCAELARVNRMGRMRLSMHVCGRWARELFLGDLDWTELPPIRYTVPRIQVNGKADPKAVFPLGAYSDTQIIVQYPSAREYMTTSRSYGMDCVPLLDASGGAGRVEREWTDLPGLGYVGYAGGIGPDNVADAVKQISEMRSGPFWIDMESGVRDEMDRLDMRKVGRVLDICEGIFNRPAFDEMMTRAEQKVVARVKV